MNAPFRAELDVADLPTAGFGARDMMWWGTVGFMAIEGTTFLICAATYLYLHLSTNHWPPERTPLPTLFWPTVQVGVMLASNIPNYLAQRAAVRCDLRALRGWTVALSVFAILFAVLRWQEFAALNVRWDTNAYGSITWLTLGFHGTVLVLQMVETIIFALFLFGDSIYKRHFSDAYDSSTYWYFMTGSWIFLYVLVFLGPKFL